MNACSLLPAYNRHSEQSYCNDDGCGSSSEQEDDGFPSRSQFIHELIQAFKIFQPKDGLKLENDDGENDETHKSQTNLSNLSPINNNMNNRADIEIVEPEKALLHELELFHSRDYLKTIFKIDKFLRRNEKSKPSSSDEYETNDELMNDSENESSDSSSDDKDDEEEIKELRKKFGLVDDAHDFPGMVGT